MDRACAFAAECGYTGIEIAPFTLVTRCRYRAGDVSPAQREEIRRQAKAAGLEVVGLHWLLAKTEGFHLTSPDAAVRKRTADYLVDLTLLCGDLGGRVMVLGSPLQRNLAEGMTKAQGMAYAAEVLCEVLPVLESQQRGAGPGAARSPGNELPAHRRRCRGTDRSRQFAADPIAPRLQGDGHRSDADRRADSPESPVAGPFPRQRSQSARSRLRVAGLRADLQGIEEVRYDGWVSVEVFDYSPGIERLARESIEYMRGIVDGLAKGG